MNLIDETVPGPSGLGTLLAPIATGGCMPIGEAPHMTLSMQLTARRISANLNIGLYQFFVFLPLRCRSATAAFSKSARTAALAEMNGELSPST
jgi:hypothetical protein